MATHSPGIGLQQPWSKVAATLQRGFHTGRIISLSPTLCCSASHHTTGAKHLTGACLKGSNPASNDIPGVLHLSSPVLLSCPGLGLVRGLPALSLGSMLLLQDDQLVLGPLQRCSRLLQLGVRVPARGQAAEERHSPTQCADSVLYVGIRLHRKQRCGPQICEALKDWGLHKRDLALTTITAREAAPSCSAPDGCWLLPPKSQQCSRPPGSPPGQL